MAERAVLFKRALLFLGLSLVAEVLFFNASAILSYIENLKGGFRQETALSYVPGEGLALAEDGSYYVTDAENAYIDMVDVGELEGGQGYVHLNVDARRYDGGSVPVTVTMEISDEGNANAYELPEKTLYAPALKTQYCRIHSYGRLCSMRLYFAIEPSYGLCTIQINDITCHAQVPFLFSVGRVCAMFGFLWLLWGLRPGSAIYRREWRPREKRAAVAVLICLNVLCFAGMIRMNKGFWSSLGEEHYQYHKLAVAFTRGETFIDVAESDTIRGLANPYDTISRMDSLEEYTSGWDTAFFEGKFYVYFGVVPVILFYLPYYLLFHSAFPTWLGILAAGSMIVAGVYFLLYRLIDRYFRGTPFAVYLILSVMVSSCVSTFSMMLRPSFYWLPIACAMAFALWGMGAWIQALELWEKKPGKPDFKTAGCWFAGALCMALTAGCRPQFTLAAVLILPLLYQPVRKAWKNCGSSAEKGGLVRGSLPCLAAVTVPFILVAAGLMYYNAIRFGSVFDFGANYNLTTNDMTRRGVNIDRLWGGAFRYLFQLPRVEPHFPFVYSVDYYSDYMGLTIEENMYGGCFVIYPFLWFLLCLPSVKKELCAKGLFGISVVSVCLGCATALLDVEMAGLLNRYYADILWLFFLAAAIVFLQLLESAKTDLEKRRLYLAFTAAGLCGIFMTWGMAFADSQIQHYNYDLYYKMNSFFLL